MVLPQLFILMAILVMVVYQDLKMRMIHIALPVALLLISLVITWNGLQFFEMLRSLGFLGINFFVVTCYFSIRQQKLINPFDQLIGWGDVLFLIAVVPLFTFSYFLLFFICGIIFSLLLHVIMKTTRMGHTTVPLVGYLSLFILTIIGMHWAIGPDFIPFMKISF